MLRSLESEPDRRYQHASDVKTDLDSMNERGFATSSQTRVRRPIIGTDWTRVGASIAEHPVLWTLAIFLTLPLIIVIAPVVSSQLSPRESTDGSVSTTRIMEDNLVIGVIVFGPLAFLAWAYLWRASHRGSAVDRERPEPPGRRLAARIDDHPILWTVAIIASLPAILAAVVLICSLMLAVLSPGSGTAWLAVSALQASLSAARSPWRRGPLCGGRHAFC